LNFGQCYLPFDLAQGGELVEPFDIWDLEFLFLQYFSTPRQLSIFTGKAMKLLTGSVVCPPCLKRTGGEINGGAAFSTLVSFIELVREYLLLCSATVTFADK
jgi:hypothetical protein